MKFRHAAIRYGDNLDVIKWFAEVGKCDCWPTWEKLLEQVEENGSYEAYEYMCGLMNVSPLKSVKNRAITVNRQSIDDLKALVKKYKVDLKKFSPRLSQHVWDPSMFRFLAKKGCKIRPKNLCIYKILDSESIPQ